MRNVDQKRYQDAQDKKNREAVNVAALVRVVSFNPKAMTVTVQPLSKYLEGGTYKSQPPILDVPVTLTKSGGFIIRPWIKAGDVGLVVYVDHDIDRAVATGDEGEPNTERNHSTSDAVFVGAIVPGKNPVIGLPDEAVVLSTEGGETYIAVMKDKVQIVGNVEIKGNATISGDVLGGGISLKTHVHGGVEGGSSNTGQPQ